ncbi:MAG: beta-glucuronidase [Lentisphaeria bacterium]|nr:beta-glucuronidase [Lentisphaeria bacterium]
MKQMRTEYPRPRLERAEWLNLNGEWQYTFDFSRSGDARDWKNAAAFEGKINVPFCPESKLSGVGFTDFIEMMWYRRTLEIPAAWKDRLILLHFGGVDYSCIVYLDGAEAGRHTGGCSPFTLDLTDKVKPGEKHNLVVRVEDHVRDGIQPLGKQCTELGSRGCSYTRTTGIWQTVWMEAVSPFALKDCRIIPDYDNGAFTFLPEFYSLTAGLKFTVSVRDGGTEAAAATVTASNSCGVTLKLPQPKEWNPETPFLYDVAYTLRDNSGKVLDEVRSYAGLRKVHLEQGRIYLNNQPVFLRFVLDQGFYEDGLWTAPSDEALRHDIELSMQAGFNGARLHQKIFDERFHYWADRLGYLTWAEFPDWGMSFWQHFRKANPEYNLSFRNYLAEWTAIVERDRNHPSIIAWTPFNETSAGICYNQEEHRRFLSDVYDLTHLLDPTRPVNDTSGYCHAKTDLWTVHRYAQSVEALAETLDRKPVFMHFPEFESDVWKGQPFLVDEYGGISYLPEGRKPYAANSWGYNKDALTREQAQQRITDLTAYLADHPLVSGYCYTQLTDIEQEQNGIYNYDRTPKFDPDAIRKCFTLKPAWSRF